MTFVREAPGQGRSPAPQHGFERVSQESSPPVAPGGLAYAWRAYPSLRFAAVILCLGIALILVWLAFLRASDGPTVASPGDGPVATSQADLAELSTRLGQPIYWAGSRAGSELEATVTTNDYVYVRYLTSGAKVGDSSPRFLTVATYPAADALRNLRSYALHGKAKITRVPGDGIAVPVPGSPTSVYFASPHADYQVEVFDPTQGEALDLIRSGAIVPVPGGVDVSTPSTG